MKVILKEYVYKHGVAGDVVTVADGFARNYLIPRGLAIKATPGALRENQHLIKQAAQRREELRSMEHEAAQKIHGVELVFGVKAGKNRKLYGSITTRDIAQALLEKTGVDINRRRISERPLRELGVHEVPVRIGGNMPPTTRILTRRSAKSWPAPQQPLHWPQYSLSQRPPSRQGCHHRLKCPHVPNRKSLGNRFYRP